MLPKRLIALSVFTALALASASSSRAQWIQTNGPAGPLWFASCGPNLFALTWEGFYRSTDSGATFSLIEKRSLEDPQITHPIAVKDSHIYLMANSGLCRSKDGGNYWSAENTGLLSQDGEITILDSTLIVSYHSGGVYRSTDGGQVWKQVQSAPNGPISSLTSIGNVAFITDSNRLYRSTDEGLRWTQLDAPCFPEYLASNGKWLFAAGSVYGNGLYRSSDSGINWQNINKDLGRDSNTIREFAASGHIIAIGPWGSPSTGYIYLSTNDGVNWMNFGSVHRFNGLGLIEGYAVAAGAFGTARRSLLDTLALSGVGAVSAFSANIQTFPTPFSQATTITFTPETSGYADVSIVNLLGVEVARIFSGELAAGEHTFTWDASAGATGDGCATGMYECLIRMNGRVEKVPVMLLR